MDFRLERENFGIFRTDRGNFRVIQRLFYRGVEKRISSFFFRERVLEEF